MNMRSNIDNPSAIRSVGDVLASARHRRRYSLGDLAETTGLTVAEIKALESAADFDPSRLRRAARALGIANDI